MARRPVWKGQIRLSLVSIPVEIFAATKSGATIAFHQIHKESGKRIRYEKVAPGIGPVKKEDIVKGFEVSKGNYVLLTDEEMEDVKLETRKTLELVQFVDQSEISPLYYDKPYYVVPQDELAEDAFRVVRDALRQSKKSGLGQLTMRGKEYLVALRPCGTGLLLETLHYAEEIQKADDLFSDIEEGKTEDDLLDVARALIAKKSSAFKAETYKNHYTAALKALIEEKRKTGSVSDPDDDGADEAPTKGGKSNVIDLMASLKKSLEGAKGGAEDEEDDDADDEDEKPRRKATAKAPARKAPAKKAAPKRKSA
ncbi:non-homologous end joining protein Ku [Aureimonas pseudogalii]|uniref:Non-homologous end joining protein Ku n=1 Tax=Aureimonas pseudogalii TaxID=1744844 RepID=A0A7W6E886_9HYPH|nr:Ku protein [Aureimonas pseudogalii]MBB3996533.1 DNA end-binding protein Ku [Aureimonas pseudogalii]